MATTAKNKTTTTIPPQDQTKSSSLENGVLSFIITVFRQVSIFGSVYMIGYMGWSIAWVIAPVVFSVAREQHRKSCNAMRKIATDSDRDVLLTHCDELPTWVYFPDVDRCEWLNCIIKQLWPCANHYIRDLVKNEVEPQLKYSLGQYHVKGFGFDHVILGAIPPRIAGIKVYEKNIRNEIIMDLELYYCSSCDIKFHLGSVRGGIKDFHLHCYARVVLKPLISTMPLVGGMQICLLRYPEIDFTMAGILEVADLPFFGELIRKLIAEQIAAVMVLPNKFSVMLSDKVPSMDVKMSEPEGVLRIHIIGAKNLMKGDFSLIGKGKCDPYAVAYVGAEKFQTQFKEKDSNPTWDYWCDAKVFAEMGQTVVFEVWSKGKNKSDDFMGRVTVDLRPFVQTDAVEKWLQLEDVKSGDLHVSMKWFKLSRNPDDIKVALQEVIKIRQPQLSSAVVTVFFDCAENLKKIQQDSLPDPYIQCSVNKQSQETATIQHCNCPIWEEGFSFLVEDPYQQTLSIQVKDRKTESTIGECEIFLCAILECENLQTDLQCYTLRNSNPDSRLAMALSLKILAHFEATDPLYFECLGYSEENIARKNEEIKRKQPPAWMHTPEPFQYDSVVHSTDNTLPGGVQRFPVAYETLKHFPRTNEKIVTSPEAYLPNRNNLDEKSSVESVIPQASYTPKKASLVDMVLVPTIENKDTNTVILSESISDVKPSEKPQETVIRQHAPPVSDSPGKKAPPKTTPLLKYTTSSDRRASAQYEKEFEIRVSTADLYSEPSSSRLASESKMPKSNEPARIELSMRYSFNREKLAVVVHRAKNLPMSDPYNLPDPFVKLYILPERTKESRRRTQVIRENCNPVFEATFEYDMTIEETKKSELEVSVCSQKDLMTDPNTILGVLVLDLDKPEIRKGIIHSWFDLKVDSKKK